MAPVFSASELTESHSDGIEHNAPQWSRLRTVTTGSPMRCGCRIAPSLRRRPRAWWSCTAPAPARRITPISHGSPALTFDRPGHGESEREFSGAAVDDVVSMVDLLAVQPGVDERRVAVR